LSQDERFKTNPDRVNHREALAEILNHLFQQKTTAKWEQEFEGSGLPYATINTMERVFQHPQIAARNMVEEMQFDAAVEGAIKVIGMCGELSQTAELLDA
jgi:succinate--hydroxymethylglutarate CoA-transferase